MVRLPAHRERTVVLAPGSIHVNMATVSVAVAREMAALHLARGIGYVVAPVLGRVDVAAAGKLNIFAGGADEMVDRVHPLFDLMGQKTWRFGAAPAGVHGIPAAGFRQAHGLPLAFGVALQTVLQAAVTHGDGDLDLAALDKHAARQGR